MQTQPKSESGTAPHQRQQVVGAHCLTTCQMKGIRSLQQKKAKEVKHSRMPVVKGCALSQAVRHDPPRCPHDLDHGPPSKLRNQAGQTRTLPFLLSNYRGFHINYLATAFTSHPNHSIKPYRTGVFRAEETVPSQIPSMPSNARQEGWEHGGTSTTARIQVHRERRLECLQMERGTSVIKITRRRDTGRCESNTMVNARPHSKKA